MKQRSTRHSYLVPRAALRKMTSQNYPMGSIINPDGPQRTPVCPSRSQDAWIRLNNSHFSYTKKYSEKNEFCHWTGCNLLQTDADGIFTPDIVFVVHKAKCNSIYMKQIHPQLHIIRFHKDSAISLYRAFYNMQLWLDSLQINGITLRLMHYEKIFGLIIPYASVCSKLQPVLWP